MEWLKQENKRMKIPSSPEVAKYTLAQRKGGHLFCSDELKTNGAISR